MNTRLERVYAVFPDEPSGYWTLDHIAVLPCWRRQGLGRDLIQKLIERGFRNGFGACKLDLFAGNGTAKELYLSLGFQVSDVFGHEALRTGLD